MLLKKFVDRTEELSFLEEHYKSNRPEFIIIYGRRRVGKTELIKQFIRGKVAFYFLAKKQKLDIELVRLRDTFSRMFGVWIKPSDSWEDVFKEILNVMESRTRNKCIIVIDEFSYWLEKDERILYTFQALWDELFSKHNVMLILMGSSVSIMSSSVLNYKSPLYGRRTSQWGLEPLKFYHLREFYPRYTFENIIKVFGCTGGIPYYLIQFDDTHTFMENIRRLFFSKGGIFFEEGEILLKEELREPYVYLDILRAISEGRTKRAEIANAAGVDITNISKYLNTLEKLDIIVRKYPVVGVPRKSKYAQIKIKDLFFNFWLRFVYPFKEEISLDIYDIAQFEESFSRYMGYVFEEIALQSLIKLMKKNKFIKFNKIGSWWFKDVEIDILALNSMSKTIIFGECKWSDNINPKKLLKELCKKQEHVSLPWEPSAVYYVLFAKSFAITLDEPNVFMFDLNKLERLL